MNVSLSKRLAATGIAGAFAAAGLVGLSTTAADAVGGAPITNTYTCTSALGAFPATLDSSIPELSAVDTLSAGSALPAELAHVVNHFTIPDDAYQQLTGVGTTKLGFPDFAGTIGGATLGASIPDVPVSSITTNSDGTHSFDANGLNKLAEMPKAGSYDVVSPESFTLVVSTPSFGDVSVPCAATPAGSAGSYGSLVITKNASTVTGKPAGKLTHKKVAKLKTKVAALNQVPTGKVLVKEGKKKLGTGTLSRSGVATVKLGKLKKGKHKVTVSYKGDGYTTAGKTAKAIVLKVK